MFGALKLIFSKENLTSKETLDRLRQESLSNRSQIADDRKGETIMVDNTEKKEPEVKKEKHPYSMTDEELLNEQPTTGGLHDSEKAALLHDEILDREAQRQAAREAAENNS